MEPGTLAARAAEDSSFYVKTSASLVAACLAALAFGAPTLLNAVAGPFAFDPTAETQGWHSYLRVEGEFEPTGVVSEKATRVLKVVTVHKEVTAEYVTVELGGKALVVKVPPGFSGNLAQGRLEELPTKIRSLLPTGPVHEVLLDATESYWLSWKLLLVGLALVLLVPCVRWAVSCVRQARAPENHEALKALGKFGAPLEVCAKIEEEFRSSGAEANVGRWWLTSSWYVCLQPFLRIQSATDTIGIGLRRLSKDNSVTYKIVCWDRGSPRGNENTVEYEEGKALMARVLKCLPWAVVADVEDFDARWRTERETLERAADARRASAGTSGTRAAQA